MKDYDSVYQLIKGAFATAEYSDGNEQSLVVRLRKSVSFIPELSLVAIVGHIPFTLVRINDRNELALARLSVSPNYQKQGVGTVLMNKGH